MTKKKSNTKPKAKSISKKNSGIKYLVVGGNCNGVVTVYTAQLPPYSTVVLQGVNEYGIIIDEGAYFVSEDFHRGHILLLPREKIKEYCEVLN